MLAGHIAIGFLGKRVESKISLGTLILASLLPDFLWCLFMIAGIEHVQFKAGVVIRPGMRALDALEATQIAYSHSLLMGVVWGGLFAILYFSRKGSSRGAWLIFMAVISHWVLDVTSHPPDMSLSPWTESRVGLGLWNSIPATLVVEGALWIIGIIVYIRSAPASTPTATFAFWIPIVILTLVWFGNIAGPPPSDPSTIKFSSLIFFLITVGWGYWCNRLRFKS